MFRGGITSRFEGTKSPYDPSCRRLRTRGGRVGRRVGGSSSLGSDPSLTPVVPRCPYTLPLSRVVSGGRDWVDSFLRVGKLRQTDGDVPDRKT